MAGKLADMPSDSKLGMGKDKLDFEKLELDEDTESDILDDLDV